jgi:hypothetical protein
MTIISDDIAREKSIENCNKKRNLYHIINIGFKTYDFEKKAKFHK